jgi:hypothetical protein
MHFSQLPILMLEWFDRKNLPIKPQAHALINGLELSHLLWPKKSRVTFPGNPAIFSSLEETRGFPSPPRDEFGLIGDIFL